MNLDSALSSECAKNLHLVSFIIPSLNQAKFIQRCLDSCLSQTITNFELIVQDGGSTDGSLEILDQYKDKIDWVSEADSGQSNAINKAIRRSSGDIIAWINSDDYYPNDNVLKTVCDTFENDIELDIVYGNGLFVDSNEKPLRKFASFFFSNPRQVLVRQATSPVAQPALFFKRELFDQVGRLREDLHWAMDHELWFRLFLNARKWQHIPQTLAHQTLHSDAKSIRGLNTQFNEIQMIKFEFLKNNSGTVSEYATTHCHRLGFFAYSLALRMGLLDYYWKWLRR